MDRFHLKNSIILILAMVNLFLLGAIGWRLTLEYNARERTIQELTQRFAAQNVTLSAALPEETPPAGRVLSRSAANDAALAKALLGSDVSASDLGGGITRYASAAGHAVFRSSGSFDASGDLRNSGAESFCRSLCQQFSLLELTVSSDGHSASALQSFEGLPVVNAAITFQLDGDRLTGAGGILLPGAADSETEPAAMTAVTALSLFWEDSRSSGVVISAITDIAPCYTLQNTAASTMTLTPAWLISTDSGRFYVDCSSHQVGRI